MQRYLKNAIVEDLKRKMVFAGGLRQVGKTVMSLDILGGDEQHPAYFNWGLPDDKRLLLQGGLPSDAKLVILDEIHKYKNWRNFVKGLYFKNKSYVSFLIPGSARLDYNRKGENSLQGRYHYYRLHPLSLYELNQQPNEKDLQT